MSAVAFSRYRLRAWITTTLRFPNCGMRFLHTFSHPTRQRETVKGFQVVQPLLRFAHFPTEELAFYAILGEVDDGESVLFKRLQSFFDLESGRGLGCGPTPGRRPGFGTCADRAGQYRDNWIAAEVELAVAPNLAFRESVEVAAQEQRYSRHRRRRGQQTVML